MVLKSHGSLDDDGRSHALCIDLPRGTRYNVGGGEQLLFNKPVHYSWADTQLLGRLLKIELPLALAGLVSRQSQVGSEGTQSHLVPGVASSGFESQTIQCESDLFIRIADCHLTDDIDSFSFGAPAMLTRLRFRDTQLRVPAPYPVDHEYNFLGVLINIRHNFLDENPNNPLFEIGVGRRRFPDIW
jgi:hypothetical protein